MLMCRAALAWAVVAVGVMAHAHAQCFSARDDLAAPASTDLAGIADFGIDLFKEIFPYNSSANFFFSPYSVWSALSLAYLGSGGDTEQQLRDVLRLPNKVNTLKNWRMLEYLYDARASNTSNTFRVANRAYFDETVELTPCVADILTSELRAADFSQPAEAAAEINEFVSNTTKGRIPQLVSADDVTNAKMVLANAAFFKGTWASQFKSSETKAQLFYASETDFHFVDMMTQKGNFRLGVSEELGAHVLELPYTGEDISMYILLPPFIAGSNGFNAMVERLNASTLHAAFENTYRSEVKVAIPKFKMEQTLNHELIEGLGAMGVSDLFNPLNVDLSTFAHNDTLAVGKAVHKAFVEVNEEGTEAAAATALISFRIARPVGPEEFIANHPFLYVIYDNDTRNVLFMGAYKNPNA